MDIFWPGCIITCTSKDTITISISSIDALLVTLVDVSTTGPGKGGKIPVVKSVLMG